jgi:hypothetical protein
MSKKLQVISSDLREEWYDSLIDECKGILTERVFNSRWELILAHWELGKRILSDNNYHKFKKDEAFVSTMARDIGCSIGNLYQSIKAYEKYPEENMLQRLPEGKNISWYKIVKEHLGENQKIERPQKKKFTLEEILNAFNAWLAEENFNDEDIEVACKNFKHILCE